VRVKARIASAGAEKQTVDGQIGSLTRDEERNRQNIASLSTVSGQQQIVQDYARKLSDQEAQIAKLRDRAAALEQQQATLQGQLNGLIENLAF